MARHVDEFRSRRRNVHVEAIPCGGDSRRISLRRAFVARHRPPSKELFAEVRKGNGDRHRMPDRNDTRTETPRARTSPNHWNRRKGTKRRRERSGEFVQFTEPNDFNPIRENEGQRTEANTATIGLA